MHDSRRIVSTSTAVPGVRPPPSPHAPRPRGTRVAGPDIAARVEPPVAAAPARRSNCLLVDPDATRRRASLKYLSTYALEARGAGSSKAARGWLQRERFDAIILYHAPPGVDGMAFVRSLRQSWSGPILLVTRTLDDFARIVALETGVSDVVDEACSRRELVARVRALLRLQLAPESRPSGRMLLHLHGLSLDLVHRRLDNAARGATLRLAEAEFRLLCCLLLSDGEVLSRDELLARMYDRHDAVDVRTVDVAVSRLRRAFKTVSADEGLLVTVRGEGYRIAGPAGD